MEKIDVFNHVLPEPFHRLMMKVAPAHADMGKRIRAIPMLVDLDVRFRVMDLFGPGYRQVLSLASPPVDAFGGPPVASDLARAANDGMAELVSRHPDRFPAFVASLALSDPAGAVDELHRAILHLGARGVQLFTNVNGRPLDAPELLPVFDAMAAYDLPIWLHPARGPDVADYPSETRSLYEIWWTFGWPYETSVAMARLVFSGLFDRHPGLKIIAHHLGAMVPFFEGRVGPGWDQLGRRTSGEDLSRVLDRLEKRPLDYFKMFYADTAVFGSYAATICGLAFYGVDRVLFASDAPFDPENGPMYIRETIAILDRLAITPDERDRLYRRNAVELLKLGG
jgi:aminocarboxymuconate-semialdehyde decarboxylase